MTLTDFLSGHRVLEEADSPINGKLTVIREFVWGTYITAGGLPQSGGLAKQIWERSLKKVQLMKKSDLPKTVLVLGFAGGGIAHIAHNYWPDSKVYGVDIDPLMIDLGKKYLHWEKTGARVWVQDADSFIDEVANGKALSGKYVKNSHLSDSSNVLPETYDLVCVDMYVGDGVPERFNTLSFVKKVNKIVSKNGMAVFNRLYGPQNRELAEKFHETLDKVYPKITVVYPEANVMFLCEREK